jgi:uncharacterized protein
MKIFFTADLHGNKKQYELLLQKSKDYDLVIIGGDLTPKDEMNRTIEKQRNFIKDFLNPLLSRISTKVIIIMGNDDFRYNEDLLIKNDSIYYCSQGKITIQSVDFICYSYIPLTPFKYKDWEKIEFDGKLERQKERDFIQNGFVSTSGTLLPYNVNLESSDSIYNDLIKLVKSNSILVSHAPPYNTFADTMSNKNHVGSKAIRKVIEEKQPILSLHGHIHESVNITKKFIDNIGLTKIISVGNYHTTPYLYGIQIILGKNITIERIKFEKDKNVA